MGAVDERHLSLDEGNFILVSDELESEVREALEGDSNDAEHDALVFCAQVLGIEYDPEASL